MKKTMMMFVALLAPMMFASVAFAQDPAAATGGDLAKFAGGLAIGLAVIGGALAQGRAAAAAVDGIARNPGAQDKIQPAMILGLALIESLVLFATLIAAKLVGLF